MTEERPTLAAARAFAAAGVSVIPVRLDGSKRPALDTWKPYQHEHAGPDRLDAWFGDGRNGLAIVCGAVSGNLVCLDIEGRAAAAGAIVQLVGHAQAAGLADALARAMTGYTETTPSGGVHIMWRVDGAPVAGNTKLARRPGDRPHTVDVLVETRGEGGYAVVAPTVDPVAGAWVMQTGGPADIATLSAEESDALLDLARLLDEMPAREPAPAAATPAFRQPSTGPNGDGGVAPGDDFNVRASWADILGPHGWTALYTRGNVTYWRRPGKRLGISATTGYARGDATGDRLYVFTTSTTFDAETSYSKFAAYAHLEHGGDLSAAARALRAQGYGAPAPTTPAPAAPAAPSTNPARPATAAPANEHQANEHQADERGDLPDLDGMSDAHLAAYVADHALRDRYLWAAALGWMAWDGRVWAEAPDEAVDETVRAFLLDRYDRAVTAQETAAVDAARLESEYKHAQAAAKAGEPPANLDQLGADYKNAVEHAQAAGRAAKAWYGTLSKGRITAISRLARGILTTDPNAFDAHPDLLNTPSGVVDLTTGELRPHDPRLLLTRITSAAYRSGARHADWDAALRAVPDDVLTWYQIRAGQAITGHTPPDDLLLVQIGGGENGKSTITAGIGAALGDYFVTLSHRVLLASPDAHPTELMDLRGARFALMEETPEERRLSVVRLKTIVGTPTITARRIRRDPVTFAATHSLFLSTNYLPAVEETDHGTWRRLAALRFPYRWRKPGEPLVTDNDRHGDPGLRDRIQYGDQGQHEAVLAWLVEGAVTWYRAGKVMPPLPERVAADTFDWRADADIMLAYMRDRLVFDPDACVMVAELRDDFNEWATERGHRPWSDRLFSTRFGGHSETQSRDVVKKSARNTHPGLSRRVATGVGAWNPPPLVFKAWHGVRFKEQNEVVEPTSENAPEAQPVTAVTDRPVNAKIGDAPSPIRVSDRSVTPVTPEPAATHSEPDAGEYIPPHERGFCARCQKPVRRFGPHGHPLCATCRDNRGKAA